ncbi:MAG: RIP metalloprotease RseP, partial [Prolixibacteraceae bacterium]
GDTEYGVGWLPLGGYVKISGMIDESMDKEAMKQPPKPWEFRAKPSWQRLLIMVGGVLMNFLFALIIYIGVLYAWGESYLPTENAKYGIVANDVAKEIGLQDGDVIVSVGNKEIENFHKIIPTIVLDNAKTIQVKRNGQIVDVEISDSDLAMLLKTKEPIMPRTPFDIHVQRIVPESPAEKAGLQQGDTLVSVDGKNFNFYDEFAQYLETKEGETIDLQIIRNGEAMVKQVGVTEEGKLGFYPAYNNAAMFQFETRNYGFFESIPAGIERGVQTTKDYLKQFKLFFRPETKAYESLGGFATIGNIFPAQWDWYSFWNMTAFISIILAIMNLLPIPALDGGHVMFLLGEMITGRKPGEKFLEYAQIAGMVLLLALVLYANANDIIKMINGTF